MQTDNATRENLKAVLKAFFCRREDGTIDLRRVIKDWVYESTGSTLRKSQQPEGVLSMDVSAGHFKQAADHHDRMSTLHQGMAEAHAKMAKGLRQTADSLPPGDKAHLADFTKVTTDDSDLSWLTGTGTDGQDFGGL
jgi:hypothetical protein